MPSQIFYMFTGFLAGCEPNSKLGPAVLSAITPKQHHSLYQVQWLFRMPFSILPLYKLSERPATEIKCFHDSNTEKQVFALP